MYFKCTIVCDQVGKILPATKAVTHDIEGTYDYG